MSEIKILSPDFDASMLSVRDLMKLLTDHDIDLPPKKQLKQFYVALVNHHLPALRTAELSKEKMLSKIKKTTPKEVTKIRTRRQSIDSQSESENQTMNSARRKLKLAKSENAIKKNPMLEDEVFSDHNPFQSPKVGKNFNAEKMVQKDSLENFEIEFSKGDVEFEGKSPGVSSPITPGSPFDSKRSPSMKKRFKSPKILSSKKDRPFVLDERIENLTKKTSMEMIHNRLVAQQKRHIRNRNLLKGCLILFISIITFYIHYLAIDNVHLTFCEHNDSSEKAMTMFYSFSPVCVECPPHSVCTPRKVTGCVDEDYKLSPSIWSFFVPDNLLPFPLEQPKCVLDGNRIIRQSKKKQQVDHLIQFLDQIIREFLGEAECSFSTYHKEMKWVYDLKLKPIGMPIALAKAGMEKMIGDRWSQKEFDEYWQLLLDKIFTESNLQVSTIVAQQHVSHDQPLISHRLLTTASTPIYSTFCRVRKIIWKTAVEHSSILLALGITIVLAVYFTLSYQQKEYEASIVVSLVEDIIHAIHTEASRNSMDSTKHPFPGIPVNQLKDHFLPRTRPTNKEQEYDSDGRLLWFLRDDTMRTKIWAKVRKEVLKNSSIRETNTQIKGEAQMVWMWIGSSSLTPARRRKSFAVTKDITE